MLYKAYPQKGTTADIEKQTEGKLSGATLFTPYVPPHPQKGTGKHRYLALLFEGGVDVKGSEGRVVVGEVEIENGVRERYVVFLCCVVLLVEAGVEFYVCSLLLHIAH